MPRRAPTTKPPGFSTVTTHLWFDGQCGSALSLYSEVFAATETAPPVTAADGRVMHALLRIGDATIMMADCWPGGWERGPAGGTSASVWLYVDDCDGVFDRAVEAGFEVMLPPADAFWGDRFGKVKDRYGHVWAIATWKWQLEPEELEQRKRKWLETL